MHTCVGSVEQLPGVRSGRYKECSGSCEGFPQNILRHPIGFFPSVCLARRIGSRLATWLARSLIPLFILQRLASKGVGTRALSPKFESWEPMYAPRAGKDPDCTEHTEPHREEPRILGSPCLGVGAPGRFSFSLFIATVSMRYLELEARMEHGRKFTNPNLSLNPKPHDPTSKTASSKSSTTGFPVLSE